MSARLDRDRPAAPDVTVMRLDEMESFFDGLVVRARASLGVSALGMQVFDLPPNFERYPNPDRGV